LIQLLHRLFADYPSIRYHAKPPYMKTLPDPIDDRNQGFDICRVTRPHLATNGFALHIQNGTYHHLI
jgi:hypothetical protein